MTASIDTVEATAVEATAVGAKTVQTRAVDADEADRILKARHSAMWATGDYPAVAAEIIPELGQILVRASGVRPGDLVLDVAAGTGNAAIAAAREGARVVASDLTPELLVRGRREARRQGVELAWRVADAEALPFRDDTFDVVLSCVGVMFAPHHQASADELVRVCKPGGTIGLLNWTPEGFIDRMFATMRPYAPPPPPGAQPAPLWGDVEHVAALLGDRVTDISAERRRVRVDRFVTPDEFAEYFRANYGPTIAAYRAIADDPHLVDALDRDLVDLARRHDRGEISTIMEWEYLLFTARKRG